MSDRPIILTPGQCVKIAQNSDLASVDTYKLIVATQYISKLSLDLIRELRSRVDKGQVRDTLSSD